MPDTDIFTLGSDYGAYLDYYGNVMYDWSLMIKRLNVRFAIWKGAQEQMDKNWGNISTKKNLSVARENGIRINGTYYWHFPDGNAQYYRRIYGDAINSENTDFICVDAEQRLCYRADGTTYKPSQNQVGETLQDLCEGLIEDFPDKRFLIYSSYGYIKEYCPQIIPFVSKLHQFTAGWPDWGLQTYRLSWEEIASGMVRQVISYDAPQPLPYRIVNIKDLGARLTDQSPEEIMWQYSSRILLPDDPIISQAARHQYDWIRYKGSEQQLYDWVHFVDPKPETPPEVTTMVGIYNQQVPVTSRGHVVMLSADDKQVDMAGVCEGSDAVMLKMCSQASGNMLVVKDAAFQTWTNRSTKAVFGVVEMDQNIFWNKEITLPVIQNRSMWSNETLRAIIEQWRAVPIPQSEWDAKKLNINANSGWLPLNGLVLMMTTTVAKGSKINGMWQQAIVDDLLKPLTTLMGGKYIPEVPIYLLASWDWYKAYASDPGWMPQARVANDQLAGLGIMRVWGQDTFGLITDVAPMATPLAKLSEVWTYPPSVDFTYPFMVDGVNYSFFIFSFNRLRATGMFYPNATVTPVACGVWHNTAAVMAAEIGGPAPVVVAPPPPPEPPTTIPVDLSDLTAKYIELKSEVERIKQWIQGFGK